MMQQVPASAMTRGCRTRASGIDRSCVKIMIIACGKWLMAVGSNLVGWRSPTWMIHSRMGSVVLNDDGLSPEMIPPYIRFAVNPGINEIAKERAVTCSAAPREAIRFRTAPPSSSTTSEKVGMVSVPRGAENKTEGERALFRESER